MEGAIDRPFYEDQLARQKAGLAVGWGWTPEMMDTDGLHVVTGPEVAKEGFTAVAATYGRGVALSVTEPYLEWARSYRYLRNYDPFYGEFGAAFVEEGARRGEELLYRPANNAFVLSRPPETPTVPTGHEPHIIEPMDLKPLWDSGVFHNALGRKQQRDKFDRVIRGHVMLDFESNVVAVAGLWEEGPGVWEIGVDVSRDARASGLGKAVVLAATRDIIESGAVPFYSCGAANIRSQRTAVSCGFVPASSWAGVGPIPRR